MPEWEISLSPDEVCKIVEDHIKVKYGIEGAKKTEAVNEWPWVNIKMGDYPPNEPVA